jgi:hypothetical protein
MFARFEAWFMSKLVERRVRKALEPLIAATVQTLVNQTAEGIPAAAPATLVSLVLGGVQEEAQGAAGSSLESSEADTEAGAPDGLYEEYSASAEDVPVEPATQESDAQAKREALAVALASRPARSPDFAELLLQARGGAWE